MMGAQCGACWTGCPSWGLDPATWGMVGEEGLGSVGLQPAYLQQEGRFPARPRVGLRHICRGTVEVMVGDTAGWGRPSGVSDQAEFSLLRTLRRIFWGCSVFTIARTTT